MIHHATEGSGGIVKLTCRGDWTTREPHGPTHPSVANPVQRTIYTGDLYTIQLALVTCPKCKDECKYQPLHSADGSGAGDGQYEPEPDFLSTELRDSPRGERVDIHVSGTVHVLDRASAEAAHARLTAGLYPWGEPGDVPTELGDYWGSTDKPGDKPSALVLLAIPSGKRLWVMLLRSSDPMNESDFAELARTNGVRICKRWTPVAP